MNTLSLLMLSALTACGTKDSDDSDDTAATGQELNSAVPQQEGRWAVTEGSWTEDQCNGPQTLQPPTSVEISDALPGSFSLDLIYEGDSLIDAPVACSLQGGDYVCSEATASWSVDDMDVNISLTGINTLTFSSESTLSGKADMEVTCAGSECDVAGEYYGISSPCTTTYNWMGIYTPE